MQPDAVIVDIDGTLALRGERSPYDWARVSEDMPNEAVVRIIVELSHSSEIIFVSGRSEVCRADTGAWLKEFCPAGELFMRSRDDDRMDAQIKEELYLQAIKPHWNVWLALDDRDQTVRMWRALGLTCLQVAPGNF